MKKKLNLTHDISLDEMLRLTNEAIAETTSAISLLTDEDVELKSILLSELAEQENIKHSILLNIELTATNQNVPQSEPGN